MLNFFWDKVIKDRVLIVTEDNVGFIRGRLVWLDLKLLGQFYGIVRDHGLEVNALNLKINREKDYLFCFKQYCLTFIFLWKNE